MKALLIFSILLAVRILFAAAFTINDPAFNGNSSLLPAAGGDTNPAYVQMVYTNNAGNSRSTVVVALTNSTTAGNCLVVFAIFDGSRTLSTLNDTLGNTYTYVTSTNASANYTNALYYSTNIAAGSCTITATYSGTGAFGQLHVYEFSNIQAYSPIDGVSAAYLTSAGAAPYTLTTPNATTTVNGDLLIGAGGCINGNCTNGVGYVTKTDATLSSLIEYAVQPTAGATNASVITSASSDTLTVMFAGFKHK